MRWRAAQGPDPGRRRPAPVIGRLRAVFPPSVIVDLVFDGPPSGGVTGRLATGLRVSYSGRVSADRVIHDGVEAQLAADGPAATWGILVVTDDRGLGDAVRAKGARTAGTAWITGRIGHVMEDRPRTGKPVAPLPKAGTTLGQGRPTSGRARPRTTRADGAPSPTSGWYDPRMIDAIQQLMQRILDILTVFVIPDWGELIGLIPVFLLVGVVGPILSLLAVAWLIYLLRAPRARVTLELAPVRAQIVDGRPAYPAGEPYCPIDQLIYPSGVVTCDACRRDLFVTCPKCATGRAAHLATCGNCGLVLKIENRARALRPAGPPPGGAAAA